MGRMLNSPVLKTTAQLSEGYLNQKVRSMGMCITCRILFDGNDAELLSKVNQEVRVEDILRSPVAIDIGGDDLILSPETLGAHGVKSALNFRLVGVGPVSLKKELSTVTTSRR